MDDLASSIFRRSFAKLTKATQVTVNGHVIGTWVPLHAPEALYAKEPRPGLDMGTFNIGPYPHIPDPRRTPTPKERQASRDAILRKINRGG